MLLLGMPMKDRPVQVVSLILLTPVAVACILAEMRLDHETLMAALLHDVIEDTPATFQDIEELFGTTVSSRRGVQTRQAQLSRQKEAQAENFRKMIMAMVKDIRVI